MKAVSFKDLKALCNHYTLRCDGCPMLLEENGKRIWKCHVDYVFDNYEEVKQIVRKWHKEHPIY